MDSPIQLLTSSGFISSQGRQTCGLLIPDRTWTLIPGTGALAARWGGVSLDEELSLSPLAEVAPSLPTPPHNHASASPRSGILLGRGHGL